MKKNYSFKHDWSEFKLRVENEKYYVNQDNETVTAVGDVSVVVPRALKNTLYLDKLPDGFIDPEFDWMKGPVKMSYTAKCAPGDDFNEELGKKIALNGLEIRAYTIMANSLDKWVNMFMEWAGDICKLSEGFQEKASRTIEHNYKYLDSLVK